MFNPPLPSLSSSHSPTTTTTATIHSETRISRPHHRNLPRYPANELADSTPARLQQLNPHNTQSRTHNTMPGLVKTGMKYGALYAAAHEAGKVLSSRNSPQTPAQRAPAPNPVATSGGYIHQTWCNAPCGLQCNGGGNRDQAGYLHQTWCNGGCAKKCNGA